MGEFKDEVETGGVGSTQAAKEGPIDSSSGIDIKRNSTKKCKACYMSKAKQKAIPKNVTKMVNNPGELMSSDISSSKEKAYG